MPKLYIYTDDPDREPMECMAEDLMEGFFTKDLDDVLSGIANFGYADKKTRVWYPPHRIKRVEWEDAE